VGASLQPPTRELGPANNILTLDADAYLPTELRQYRVRHRIEHGLLGGGARVQAQRFRRAFAQRFERLRATRARGRLADAIKPVA
jgi:hypothetical protein